MVHNFWSHAYLVDSIRITAENYGINVKLVDESYTSSLCPRCGSRDVYSHNRLFKCLSYGLEAHIDAVGCVNIRLAQEVIPAGVINGSVARPLLLSFEA